MDRQVNAMLHYSRLEQVHGRLDYEQGRSEKRQGAFQLIHGEVWVYFGFRH